MGSGKAGVEMKGRYELKFPIDFAMKDVIVKEASHGLKADANGVNAVYRVSSMYFDTPDYTAYWEKLDGEEILMKYRLRYYTVEDNDGQLYVRNGFMEIKHRINNTVFKERVALTDEGANTILKHPESELKNIVNHVKPEELEKKTTLSRLTKAANIPGFTGVNIITYLREAWEGIHDHRLRVTFDSSCMVYRPDQYGHVGNHEGQYFLPPDKCILEVKFNQAIPRWIRDIVNKYQVKLQRFSKYCTGLEMPGIVNRTGRHDIKDFAVRT